MSCWNILCNLCRFSSQTRFISNRISTIFTQTKCNLLDFECPQLFARSTFFFTCSEEWSSSNEVVLIISFYDWRVLCMSGNSFVDFTSNFLRLIRPWSPRFLKISDSFFRIALRFGIKRAITTLDFYIVNNYSIIWKKNGFSYVYSSLNYYPNICD